VEEGAHLGRLLGGHRRRQDVYVPAVDMEGGCQLLLLLRRPRSAWLEQEFCQVTRIGTRGIFPVTQC
jgi:hypothetical protein